MSLRRKLLLAPGMLCLAGLLMLPLPASAAGTRQLETGIKAAYLFRFLFYVDWPAERFERADSPYVIGVLGNEDVHAELLRTIGGRSVNGRPVQVRRLRDGEGFNGLHVLYTGAEYPPAPAQAIPGLLTVTSIDAPPGKSIINLRLIDGRLRFEVSMPAAERNQLRLSSRMLSIAATVYTGGG